VRWGGIFSIVLAQGLAEAGPPGASRQEPEPAPLVERIEVVGNRLLRRETLLYWISSKPDDRYDERRLREDFKRLWDTGFFDNLRVETADGTRGKVVTFVVEERRRIQVIDYSGSKQLTRQAIEDELGKRGARIELDTFYDTAKARKVEAIIKEMLAARGRPFATVKTEAKDLGASGQQLSFAIDEGPKASVEEIVFDGNQAFSDATLRGRLKKVKHIYTEDKWLGGQEDPRGDRGRIEDFYLNRGYVTARVGQPRITYTDKPGGNKKKPVKYVKLEIPVTEGAQFRMGSLKFKGLTVLKEPFVRSLFKLNEGDVYDDSRFKKAYEKLRDVYGSLGYFQWTGGTERKPDPEKKVVGVTVKMEEDKRYFLGKLNFTGNGSTRDKVIRREIHMNEGDVFNTEALKLSIKRINQLGYFKPMESAPEIQPSQEAENKVDVTFKVEEQNRNQFSFGGGFSGYEGAFVNASFSTTNFLGAGETLQAYVQSGDRTRNYSLSVSEPYFLDRPITAGADLFKRRIVYESSANVTGYTKDSTGATLVTGFMVGKWSRAYLNYTYDVTRLSGVDPAGLGPFRPGAVGVPAGLAYDPLLFGERTESRLTPSLVYNTVDNPYMPRAGMRHTAGFAFTGGPLGGTIDYYSPSLETILYLPLGKRMALGLRAKAAMIRSFGDTRVLPTDLRYFMGGETQIRGYDVLRVGPVDVHGLAVGGNKFGLFNAEYYFDLFGPVRALAFFDAGQAFLEGDPIDPREFRISTGAELRVTVPVLNVPFRLIYAVNPNRKTLYERLYTPYSTFKFAIGTTF